jgi:TRAP-type transport system small permease protein
LAVGDEQRRWQMQAGTKRAATLLLRIVNKLCDGLALSALAAMVLVVSWQIFGRFVLNSSPRWTSEVALLLLVWLGLLGIAIGARDQSHIAIGFVVARLPQRLATVVKRLAPALMLLFGLYLVSYGWSFTLLTMSSTLPSTGLPTSVQYAAMPIAGALISVYGGLQLLGVETRRDTQDEPAEGLSP